MSDVQPGMLPALDEPGDAELISAVRAGDVHAYGTLFERHVEAARRLARQLVSAGDVDDLVSEAFAKVLGVLQKGGGPDLAFRAYLLTSLRRLHVDKLRSAARLTTTDDMSAYDPGVPFEDTAVAGFDNQAAAKAFAQLPERWQQVLWHTEVEGQKPAEIAPLLGMTPNSVSALAYRAREGLRQAFISMHAQDADDDACATTRANLGAYIRGGLSKRDAAKVEAHLEECRACTAIYLELVEVNSNLGALLAPLLLGSAGAAYLAAAGTGAKAGLLVLLGRGKDWVLHNPAGRVTAAGVSAAAVAVAAVALAAQVGGDHPHRSPQADNPPSAAAPSSRSSPPGSSSPSPHPKPRPTHHTMPAIAPPRPQHPAAGRQPSAPSQAPPPSSSPPHTTPTQQPEQAPVIAPLASVTARPGRPVVIDLTKGASDPNGDRLSVKSASVASPAHGTVVKGSNAGRPMVSGGGRFGTSVVVPLARPAGPVHTVTYTPDEGWRGTDTILYTLTDGHGGTVSGSVKVITRDAPPVAQPITVDDTTILNSVLPKYVWPLRHASDANHDRLTFSIGKPEFGRAVKQGDGRVAYFAKAKAHSYTDHFSYTVVDHHGGRDTAVVTVHVTVPAPPPPPAPVSGNAGLKLTTEAGNGHAVQRLRVSAHGIPKGKTASFSYALTGPVVGLGDSSSACGPPTQLGMAISDNCTVRNGDLLQLHFVPVHRWTFHASLTPIGFVDPSPGNNNVAASGGLWTGKPSAGPSPGHPPSTRWAWRPEQSVTVDP